MFESLALRSETFKVMALVALTTVQTQDTHVSEIVDLKTILERVSQSLSLCFSRANDYFQCLLASHLPQTHLEYHIDPQSLILELSALSECHHDSQVCGYRPAQKDDLLKSSSSTCSKK